MIMALFWKHRSIFITLCQHKERCSLLALGWSPSQWVLIWPCSFFSLFVGRSKEKSFLSTHCSRWWSRLLVGLSSLSLEWAEPRRAGQGMSDRPEPCHVKAGWILLEIGSHYSRSGFAETLSTGLRTEAKCPPTLSLNWQAAKVKNAQHVREHKCHKSNEVF